MPKQIHPKIVALTFGILAISFLAAFYVIAWQEPAQAPPGGNVAAPINVSNTGQIKTGNLVVNALGISAVSGNALTINSGGNLCLGADCRSSWPGGGGLGTPAFYTRSRTGEGAVYCNCGDLASGGGINYPGASGGTPGVISRPEREDGWYCRAYFYGDWVANCYAKCANTTTASEGCTNCWAGSSNYTSAPDTYDQNCNGVIDEYTPAYSKTCPAFSIGQDPEGGGPIYAYLLKSDLLNQCMQLAGGSLSCSITCNAQGSYGWYDYNLSSCSAGSVYHQADPAIPACFTNSPIICSCPAYYR